jgi:CO/xanthine dehydrogenase FAD-binding subunit
LLVGKTPDETLIAQVAESVQTETDPASDARASAWYRQKVTAALVRRVLAQLA